MGIGIHTKPNRGITNDWITPPEILKALGTFDLDPCVCTPQPWPTARQMFNREQNGLSQEWHGRVWLNPPYGPEAWEWLAKLAEHGRGTALIFARTETEGFVREVWRKADAMLFLEGRLHFHHPNGARAKGNSGGPSVLVAYGADDAEKLADCGLTGAYQRGWTVK